MINSVQERVKPDNTDKFEMFGGHVDFMDSDMLGLQDRRGQYIVVRCSSHRAAQASIHKEVQSSS